MKESITDHQKEVYGLMIKDIPNPSGNHVIDFSDTKDFRCNIRLNEANGFIAAYNPVESIFDILPFFKKRYKRSIHHRPYCFGSDPPFGKYVELSCRDCWLFFNCLDFGLQLPRNKQYYQNN